MMTHVYAAILVVLTTSVACFGPSVSDCAVQCGQQGFCPQNTTCLADGYCHNSRGEALCQAAPDGGGEDAGTNDGPIPDGPPVTGCGDGEIDLGADEECDDNNTASNDGCSSQCKVEDGFRCFGGPSECGLTPDQAGQVVITEIMKDPCADPGNNTCRVADGDGEWFELHNPGPVGLYLEGLTVRNGNGGESFDIDSLLFVPVGGHVVLGNNANQAENGGVALDFEYLGQLPDGFVLANGSDEVVVANGKTEIDRVNYNDTNGANSFPDTKGASLSLSSQTYDAIQNNLGPNWCDGVTPYGLGDLGTPGEQNPPCQ